MPWVRSCVAGSQQQKEAFLPRLVGSQAGLASFAITESTGGSDLEAMTTFAARTDKGFLINGRKDYILNAPVADLICVFAMADHLRKKVFYAVLYRPPCHARPAYRQYTPYGSPGLCADG